MSQIDIRRLTPGDAPLIVDCFQRVYGDSYANELFYDVDALAHAMREGKLSCVGAQQDARLLGHMAMTIATPGLATCELGNTVVDPAARGVGIAWKVGDELTRWCTEAGFLGFLHYPTTDHHIMQQQSVKAGFETGLMLSYIPTDTDGKVGAHRSTGRQAATVVYQPLAPAPAESLYCPEPYQTLLTELASATPLSRTWLSPADATRGTAPEKTAANTKLQKFGKRGLSRLTMDAYSDGDPELEEFLRPAALEKTPCQHLDLAMDQPNIDQVAQRAAAAGFAFCAWLPGFGTTDVLRLQRVDPMLTEMHPGVVNPTAQQLLATITT